MKVFEVLRIEFEEKKAENIAHGIEVALDTHDTAMMKDIATKGDIAELRNEVRVDMANMRADLIRWMFVFWMGQFATTVGAMTAIIFVFLRK
ncbi:MAG: hypothetical protein CVU77_07965 [Elusimicrobia bacterium HGW-Elusimicrobia-1]|jgi:hypothetical protein|nr:MAG: hypothetical protein CVU77_07965 [Elusimicrobia bacterium HGW-Elusimicrobia-1]